MLYLAIFNYELEFLVVGVNREACASITTQKAEPVLPLCLEVQHAITEVNDVSFVSVCHPEGDCTSP
jgi:hypothetical protein